MDNKSDKNGRVSINHVFQLGLRLSGDLSILINGD